jgi:hypothetical protein
LESEHLPVDLNVDDDDGDAMPTRVVPSERPNIQATPGRIETIGWFDKFCGRSSGDIRL